MEKIIDCLKQLHPEIDYLASKDFISDGLLDSFDVVELIALLNKAYGISIKGWEIDAKDFSTLESINALVQKNSNV